MEHDISFKINIKALFIFEEKRRPSSNFLFLVSFLLNPHTPVAQKVADEVVFRRFIGEEVEFFKIGPR